MDKPIDLNDRRAAPRTELIEQGHRQARIHGVPAECAPIYAEGWAAAAQAVLPAVLTIQPGQRILLAYNRALNKAEAVALIGRLTELYPDVQFHIADQVHSVVVLPQEEEE